MYNRPIAHNATMGYLANEATQEVKEIAARAYTYKAVIDIVESFGSATPESLYKFINEESIRYTGKSVVAHVLNFITWTQEEGSLNGIPYSLEVFNTFRYDQLLEKCAIDIIFELKLMAMGE